jgi:hypothetical protein
MLKLLPAVLSSLAFISQGALAAEGTQDTSKADQYLSQENKADPSAKENVDKNRDAREQRDRVAGDPVKPEIGAGPHRDRSSQQSGAGSSRDKTPPAAPPVKPSSPDASAGSSSAPDAVQGQADERKASEAKEKMKKKPGYQEEAPSPRASHTGLIFN